MFLELHIRRLIMLVYPIVDINFNPQKCSLSFSTIKLLLLSLYLTNLWGDALRLCNYCFSADFHLSVGDSCLRNDYCDVKWCFF